MRTDDDVLADIKNDESEEEDENDSDDSVAVTRAPAANRLSKRELVDIFDKLRKHMETLPSGTPYGKLDDLERVLLNDDFQKKQTKITHFFASE